MRIKYPVNFILVGLVFIAGCSNPVNRVTAARYYQMGVQAEQSGNLVAARESYRRATLNADWGMLGPRIKAHTLYEYGRVSGYLCHHEEAEWALHESLKFQEKDREARLELRPPTLLELARFYYDTDQKPEAMPYYKEGIQLLRRLNFKQRDPVRFAVTLEEYADCLRTAGREDEAADLEAEAETVRTDYTGPGIGAPFRRYNTRCAARTS